MEQLEKLYGTEEYLQLAIIVDNVAFADANRAKQEDDDALAESRVFLEIYQKCRFCFKMR